MRNPNRLRGSGCALLTAAILAGCSATTPEEGDTPVPFTPTTTFDDTPLADLSDFEASIFKDGNVTDDELAEATDVVKSCLLDADIEIEMYDDLARPSSVSALFPSEPEYYAAEQDCRANVNAVEEVWILLNAPSATDLENAGRTFSDCIATLQGASTGRSFEDAVKFFNSESESATLDAGKASCAADYRQVATEPSPGLGETWAKYTSQLNLKPGASE
ncbi:hypothetical protein [Oerskovia enterophila]|uniref:hypothetical protein n=1 Tax=Oerskovia enterophila TaxID=43678 RepID=UPI001112A84D|nr:hypothetical protein [Oerskovia enterophila]